MNNHAELWLALVTPPGYVSFVRNYCSSCSVDHRIFRDELCARMCACVRERVRDRKDILILMLYGGYKSKCRGRAVLTLV